MLNLDYWWSIIAAILALPIFFILVFSAWIRKQRFENTEIYIKCWDVFIKLVSALTVVAAGAMVFAKYVDQRAIEESSNNAYRHAELLSARLADKKLHFLKSEELFSEAARIATRIANSDSPSERDMQRFNELYFADLIGVEKDNGPVEQKMVCLRRRMYEETETPECRPLTTNQIVLSLSESTQQELRVLRDEISALGLELNKYLEE